jgi:hypothetical protein
VDLGRGPLPTAGGRTWDSGLFIAAFSPEGQLGSHFSSPVQVDGKPYTSQGASDLIYFQLTP